MTDTTPSIPGFLSTSLLSAAKLSDDNWVEWSENMEMFLMGAQTDWVTTGTVPAGKEGLDKALVAYIFASMEPDQRFRLKGIKSAVVAWSTLKTAYNKSTMGRRIRARDAIDSVEHDISRNMDFYIQSVVSAFEVLKNLGETISDTAIGDHILRHLHPSYNSVRTTILAQEVEPKLDKIKAMLLGSASSDFVKSEPMESGLIARFGGRQAGKDKARREPEVDGFQEGKYRWCDKGNNDNCHRCGREGHIARLCARDMPSSIKDLVISGARAYAAHRAYQDLVEQDSPDLHPQAHSASTVEMLGPLLI